MKLWVIRHAKSSWKDPGLSDFDRPLNGRGKRDAPRMAEWIAGQTDPPTYLVSSDAARARATAEFVQKALRLQADQVVFEPRLYLAGAETVLDVVREARPDCESLAIVGHNPGLTDFINALAGGDAVADLPTFGVARLTVPGTWTELRPGRATLDFCTSPKRLD